MQSLYKKIMKGTYPEIPEHFSQDLKDILNTVLVVSTKKRLSASEIMDHPVFKARSMKYYPESFNENQQYAKAPNESSFLLKTIKFPKNIS
jgi:NIMA (never in mitosis gene a)-related kinase